MLGLQRPNMLWDKGIGWSRLFLCSVLCEKRGRRAGIGRKKSKHANDVNHKTNTDNEVMESLSKKINKL